MAGMICVRHQRFELDPEDFKTDSKDLIHRPVVAKRRLRRYANNNNRARNVDEGSAGRPNMLRALPAELLVEILSYLRAHELARMARVNRFSRIIISAHGDFLATRIIAREQQRLQAQIPVLNPHGVDFLTALMDFDDHFNAYNQFQPNPFLFAQSKGDAFGRAYKRANSGFNAGPITWQGCGCPAWNTARKLFVIQKASETRRELFPFSPRLRAQQAYQQRMFRLAVAVHIASGGNLSVEVAGRMVEVVVERKPFGRKSGREFGVERPERGFGVPIDCQCLGRESGCTHPIERRTDFGLPRMENGVDMRVEWRVEREVIERVADSWKVGKEGKKGKEDQPSKLGTAAVLETAYAWLR